MVEVKPAIAPAPFWAIKQVGIANPQPALAGGEQRYTRLRGLRHAGRLAREGTIRVYAVVTVVLGKDHAHLQMGASCWRDRGLPGADGFAGGACGGGMVGARTG